MQPNIPLAHIWIAVKLVEIQCVFNLDDDILIKRKKNIQIW
jgi:hypothetical protein